jgi:hypothetical protein
VLERSREPAVELELAQGLAVAVGQREEERPARNPPKDWRASPVVTSRLGGMILNYSADHSSALFDFPTLTKTLEVSHNTHVLTRGARPKFHLRWEDILSSQEILLASKNTN